MPYIWISASSYISCVVFIITVVQFVLHAVGLFIKMCYGEVFQGETIHKMKAVQLVQKLSLINIHPCCQDKQE